MASSSKSEKLGLSLWEASDMPERLDFRGDNEALESLVGGHLSDALQHLTTDEKEILKRPWYVTTHMGGGASSRVKEYPQLGTIKYAFYVAQGHAPVEYDANGKAHIYWDIAGLFHINYSTISASVFSLFGGLELRQPRSLVTFSKTLDNGNVVHMNDLNTRYLGIIFPDAG